MIFVYMRRNLTSKNVSRNFQLYACHRKARKFIDWVFYIKAP